MIINSGTLNTLCTGFSTAFQGGFGATPSFYQRVAQVVPSTSRQNEYGWLGQIPRVREWIGDRVVQNISARW
jgi:phage major head subunit gpT-like protein